MDLTEPSRAVPRRRLGSGGEPAPQIRTVLVAGVPTEAVVFAYRRLRACAMVVGSLVFVVLGLTYAMTAISAILAADSVVDAAVNAMLTLFLLVLGIVSMGFFGLTGIAWIGTALGRYYVALTAEALVVRDPINRAVVPWDAMGAVRATSASGQSFIAIRLRKHADVPVTRRSRWLQGANRRMGLGNAAIWVSSGAIHASGLLQRALRWHKKAPRTAAALTEGYTLRWEQPPTERTGS